MLLWLLGTAGVPSREQAETGKQHLHPRYHNVFSLKFQHGFITSKDIQHFHYICKLNLIHLLKSGKIFKQSKKHLAKLVSLHNGYYPLQYQCWLQEAATVNTHYLTTCIDCGLACLLLDRSGIAVVLPCRRGELQIGVRPRALRRGPRRRSPGCGGGGQSEGKLHWALEAESGVMRPRHGWARG